jgi:hypothetical protein
MGGKTGSTLVSDGVDDHISSSCLDGPSCMVLTRLTLEAKTVFTLALLACAPAELAQTRRLGAGAGRPRGAGCPR